MAEYKAIIHWERTSEEFLEGKYSREHTWGFDGGVIVPASSSPSVVPTPWSNPACVDPEEAFVAAISSCHMLTFLYLAGKQGFQVDCYDDTAIGKMTKGGNGVPWVSSVVLHPDIVFSGAKIPSPQEIGHLHHLAHEECYIANSVKTEITVGEPAARHAQ